MGRSVRLRRLAPASIEQRLSGGHTGRSGHELASVISHGAMTRDEQVRAVATNLKIRARVFALKRLVLYSASAFERADAALSR